jgi:predicted DNA-binding transcriptional regulator YafY
MDMPRPLPLSSARRSPLSRPPLERMRKLHQALQANRYPNCRTLAVALEVSPKTIQRDIDFMRDQWNMPIAYDQLKFGFYYSAPVTHFPTAEVTEGEIVALLVAQKALTQYRGTSFEKTLRNAFHRITEGLQDTMTFRWSELDEAVSFRGVGSTVADIELFEIVSHTVLKSIELTFEYQKLGASRHEQRRVQPYHLSCIDQQWYLFAFDLTRNQLRTFVLPRMRKARTLKTRFTRPSNFSIAEHLSQSFGVFSGKGRYKVRIAFDAFAAQLVREREWHPSQKTRPLPDAQEGIELQLELGSLQEVERWVLSWGSHAKVLEPAELRARVRASARALLEQS